MLLNMRTWLAYVNHFRFIFVLRVIMLYLQMCLKCWKILKSF